MALIKTINSDTSHRGLFAGAVLGILRRHEERRLQAALASKPDRLLRDMGVDPESIGLQPWAYQLGPVQAIGNRP